MDNELLKGYKKQKLLWIEKINFFREEKIIAYDAGKIFGLKKEIEKIEKEIEKIDEILENNPSTISKSEIDAINTRMNQSQNEISAIINGNNNAVFQGIYNSQIDNSTTINNISQDKKISKFLASNVEEVNEEDFLGREKEIKEIRKRLTENKKLTLINGEGGIGKTTLAAKYWQDNQNNYKHLAWLFCDNGIIETVKTTLSQAINLDLKNIPEDSQIDFLINHLNNLEKDCLLILDNANDKDELERFRTEFSGLNWHILLTSRCENVTENQYYIDHLPPDLAKKLFKKHYDEKTNDFDELLDLFLESIGYNTLCIEIFSKTLRENELLSMSELMKDLAAKGLFLDDKTEEIQVNWTSSTKKHKANTSDSIIKELYNISNLDENESRLLNQFAVLPAQNHDLKILLELFQPQDKYHFQKQLKNLNKKGWISFSSKSYRISPVVQKILLSQGKDKLFEDCEELIESFVIIFSVNRQKEEHFSRLKYLSYIDKIVELFWNSRKETFISFLNAVAVVKSSSLERTGFLYAKKCYEKIITLQDLDANTFWVIKSNLALCLWRIGDENYINQANIIMSEFFKNEHLLEINDIDKAVLISNHGLILREIEGRENLLKAKEKMELALNIALKNNEVTLISLFKSNLAITLYKIDDKNVYQAIDLLEEAINMNILILGENSLRIIRDRMTLATIFKDLNKNNKTILQYEKALFSARKIDLKGDMMKEILFYLSAALLRTNEIIKIQEAEIYLSDLKCNYENDKNWIYDINQLRYKVIAKLYKMKKKQYNTKSQEIIENYINSEITSKSPSPQKLIQAEYNLAETLKQIGGKENLLKAESILINLHRKYFSKMTKEESEIILGSLMTLFFKKKGLFIDRSLNNVSPKDMEELFEWLEKIKVVKRT